MTQSNAAPAAALERIVELAASRDAHRVQFEVVSRMEPSLAMSLDAYRHAAEHKTVPDIRTVLWAASRLTQPTRYLEVGVRRGHSLCSVVEARRTIDVTVCDLWLHDYGGEPNPGPAWVQRELAKFGHTGRFEVFRGDSRDVLPSLIQQKRQFDLIFIDGDHSEAGATTDLEHALALLSPSGHLVFDDLDHPQHRYLREVWISFVKRHGLTSIESTPVEGEYGWSIARQPDHVIERFSHTTAPAVDNSPVVIFGTGTAGRQALQRLRRDGARVAAFADNAADRHGTELEALPVVSPSAIASLGDVRVVIASAWWRAIARQLLDLGLPQDRLRLYRALDDAVGPLPSADEPVASAGDGSRSRVKVAGDYAAVLDVTRIDSDSDFAAAIRRLIREHRPLKIVETGTYLGEGTTRVIADALREVGATGAQFHSIEINARHLETARTNLSRDGLDSLVQLHQGLSVPRTLLPSLEEIERRTVQDIDEEDIFVDHREHERAALYYSETNFDGPDDLLGRVLREFDGRPDFVLLDSGGHMGNIEFNYLLAQLSGPCWIALDDVHHIKHRRSLRQMQRDSRFEIVVTSAEKFGFCLARFTPAVEPDPSIERLLWVRVDSIGDAVLASSILPWLPVKYPNAAIAVVCQDRVADLYLGAPMVERVIRVDRRQTDDVFYVKRIVDEIADFRPQLILNSTRSRDVLSELLTLAVRDARHVCIQGDLHNISAANHAEAHERYELVVPSSPTTRSELGGHSDFLAGLGIRATNLQPIVWTTPAAEAAAEAFFASEGLSPAHTIAVFPGAQADVRVYPGYADALASIEGFRLVVFGTQAESALAADLTSRLGARVLDVCGRFSLPETAAVLRRCRLYVGAESAGAHMACALGVPNVVVLGGGHFGRFMPYSPLTSAVALPLDCYGCDWTCAFPQVHCTKGLGADVLAEAVQRTLERPASRPRIFIPVAAGWTNEPGLPQWQRPERFLRDVDADVIGVESAFDPTGRARVDGGVPAVTLAPADVYHPPISIDVSAPIVIFGAGEGGRRALHRLRQIDSATIAAFSDNAVARHGTVLESLPVIAPTEIPSLGDPRVLIATVAWRAVGQQLEELGMDTGRLLVYDAVKESVRPLADARLGWTPDMALREGLKWIHAWVDQRRGSDR